MPTIVPPSRNDLGAVIAELESLGGKAKTDFRIGRARTGAAVVEVSDELYGKWGSRAKSKRVGLRPDDVEGADRELSAGDPPAAAPAAADGDDENQKTARKSRR